MLQLKLSSSARPGLRAAKSQAWPTTCCGRRCFPSSSCAPCRPLQARAALCECWSRSRTAHCCRCAAVPWSAEGATCPKHTPTCSQGRFPSNHPVSHSPQASTWAQVSSLAALRHAVLTKRPEATTIVSCELRPADDEDEVDLEIADCALDAAGGVLAVARPQAPRFYQAPLGHKWLNPGTINKCHGSSGVWAPTGQYAFVSSWRGGTPPTRADEAAHQRSLVTPEVLTQAVSLQGRSGRLHSVDVFDAPPTAVSHPDVAWSGCAQYFAWSGLSHRRAWAGTVNVYSLRSERVTKFSHLWPGAWAWAPQGSQLLYISAVKILRVLNLGGAEPCCTLQLSLAAAFGNLTWHVTPFGLHFGLQVSMDCHSVIVGRSGRGDQAPCVAVVQLLPHPQVLGQCQLHGDVPSNWSEEGGPSPKFSFGVDTCAVWVPQAGEDEEIIYLIGLDGALAGQVVQRLHGIAAAFSPCRDLLAVIADAYVVVLRQSTGAEVSSWIPQQALGLQQEVWALDSTAVQTLIWRSDTGQTGQLEVSSVAVSPGFVGTDVTYTWFIALLTW